MGPSNVIKLGWSRKVLHKLMGLIDYQETFAPIAKLNTALVVNLEWPLH